MTETLRVVAAVGGVVLIVGMLSDAVATLIVTQGTQRPLAADPALLRGHVAGGEGVAARLPDRSGEYVLNVYPALSLLGLLVAVAGRPHDRLVARLLGPRPARRRARGTGARSSTTPARRS